MTTYVSDVLREQVKQGAGDKCEYCLIADSLSAKGHEVDHIFAEKHHGSTVLPNLCLSCYYCNRHKGSDLCSMDPLIGDVVNLFHPRRDRWEDHFELKNARIEALTPTGRVTVELLRINAQDRLTERQLLIRLNRYP